MPALKGGGKTIACLSDKGHGKVTLSFNILAECFPTPIYKKQREKNASKEHTLKRDLKDEVVKAVLSAFAAS